MADFNTPEIHTAMECPVCYDVLHPPIHVCTNGHGLCFDCYKKLQEASQELSSCPLCRGNYQLLPSHLLELIYDRLEVTCKYGHEGCKFSGFGADVKAHHRRCKLRPRPCPRRGENCNWEGPRTMLTKHVIENHM